MYDLIIKNGKVVLATEIISADLAIQNGKIVDIIEGKHKETSEKIIDAKGMFIFPGAIDTHSHLNEPGYEWREDYEHGSAAAIVGGYTTLIDMPMQNTPAMTNAELLDRKLKIVENKSFADYCFWGGVVRDNYEDLEGLFEKGCVGFKAFVGPVSSDYCHFSYGELYIIMKKIASLGGRLGVHCEDYTIIKECEKVAKAEGKNDWKGFVDTRPEVAEMVATLAVVEMAKATGCKLHICHVSSNRILEKIKQAQEEGYDITAETCTHYLCMTTDDVVNKGELYKCSPALRSQETVNSMWDYVANGFLTGIGSDHSPCTFDEKYKEILGKKIETAHDVWGGISGIQSLYPVVFHEAYTKRKLELTKLAEVLSTRPAKAFGLYGRKGEIKVGFDADLVILDPYKEWEITEESLLYVNKMSAYVGMKGVGTPVYTILRGNVMAENGKVVGKKGTGVFLKRETE